MNFFRKRQIQAAAYQWKREYESQLRMEIEIEAALLHNLRTQLAEFRQLEGEQLVLRFLCETPKELEHTMRGKRTWWEEVKALWCWSKHPENTAKAA